MRVTQIVVDVEMRVSDNDYGNQRAGVQLTAALEAWDVPGDCLEAILAEARRQVERELGHSPTLAVRRKLVRKDRLCDECQQPLSDDQDYLHPECEGVRKARRELAAVGVSMTDDDDDLPI